MVRPEPLEHETARPDLHAQLAALPDHVVGEIINGSLVVMPRPAIPHAKAGSDLGSELGVRFGRRPGGDDLPGGWWILSEPELDFGADVIVPDLAGWKRERLPALPRAARIAAAPDWACEILSPRTAKLDRGAKAAIYHREGVTWRWLVDPIEHTLEAYRREGAFWVLLGVWEGDQVVRVEPFDAVGIDMTSWWEGIEPEGA